MLTRTGILGQRVISRLIASGPFGPPTGAYVHVMGMAHAEFGALVTGQPLIRREYALIDETAIWKQILLHTGET